MNRTQKEVEKFWPPPLSLIAPNNEIMYSSLLSDQTILYRQIWQMRHFQEICYFLPSPWCHVKRFHQCWVSKSLTCKITKFLKWLKVKFCLDYKLADRPILGMQQFMTFTIYDLNWSYYSTKAPGTFDSFNCEIWVT